MNKLRAFIISVAAAVAALSGLYAAAEEAEFRNITAERTQNGLQVSFDFDATGADISSDQDITYTPTVTDGMSRVELPKIIFAGRNRYIQNQRRGVPAPGDHMLRKGESLHYIAVTPMEPWMEECSIIIDEQGCDCGGFLPKLTAEGTRTEIDFRPRVFSPEWVYAVPRAEKIKNRRADGMAFIDFRVNDTVIDPSYRRNPRELKNIVDTIMLVANDPDSHIETITVTGYASPEGSYANNVRLADGRTRALVRYVAELSHFPANVFHTASVPENWAGLRKYVLQSDLEDREGILAIIDMENLEPDKREWRLKKSYPAQYRFLYENVYPGLRRTNYTINYTVVNFTDPAKIAEVMATDPSKLSLNELYALAETLPTDSEEFREVFEVAVRLNPKDPVANLNAAVTSLRFNDLTRAATLLKNAGDSPQAEYARAILAAKEGDSEEALRLMDASPLPEAKAAAESLRESLRWK